MKSRTLTGAVSIAVALTMLSCGSDAPVKHAHSPGQAGSQRRHNYSAAWIYSVGEVDSLGASDCAKARSLLEGERDCNGQACRPARDIARDYLASCGSIDSPDQVSKVKRGFESLRQSAAQPPYQCTDKVNHWMTDGCGGDGACQPDVQRWATRCAAKIRSPLTVQILERVIENSLTEPHRVKLDVQGCPDLAKSLNQTKNCSISLTCDAALLAAAQYLARCAEGKNGEVPLREALSIARITLDAEKDFKPIAVTAQPLELDTTLTAPILSDLSGQVLKVCGEPTTDLGGYLDQRRQCENGEVVLLRAASRDGNRDLGLVRAPHRSDEAFALAFPGFAMRNEDKERDKRGLAQLNQVLDSLGTSREAALKALNTAYAALPLSLRRSDRVRQVLAQHETVLIPIMRELSDAKTGELTGHLSGPALVSLVNRALKLPFSDVSADGQVRTGAVCDLSELSFGPELKTVHDAYANPWTNLEQRAAKTKIKGTPTAKSLSAFARKQAKICGTARQHAMAAVSQFNACLSAREPCDNDEQKVLWQKLRSARDQWREARAREIVLNVSAGLDDTPSDACGSF